MIKRFWNYIKLGWRIVTEASTIAWLYSVFSASSISAIAAGVVAFYGEHSPAILLLAFLITLLIVSALFLSVLGYRREISNARVNPNQLTAPPKGEINARTIRRYEVVADAIRYIADESEWGARIRAVLPDKAGLKPHPRFAAIEELVRAARNGEISVFGRLNRIGEHVLISQQYWLYATIETGSAIGATETPAFTISANPDVLQREQFTIYDALCVERDALVRVWPPAAKN